MEMYYVKKAQTMNNIQCLYAAWDEAEETAVANFRPKNECWYIYDLSQGRPPQKIRDITMRLGLRFLLLSAKYIDEYSNLPGAHTLDEVSKVFRKQTSNQYLTLQCVVGTNGVPTIQIIDTSYQWVMPNVGRSSGLLPSPAELERAGLNFKK